MIPFTLVPGPRKSETETKKMEKRGSWQYFQIRIKLCSAMFGRLMRFCAFWQENFADPKRGDPGNSGNPIPTSVWEYQARRFRPKRDFGYCATLLFVVKSKNERLNLGYFHFFAFEFFSVTFIPCKSRNLQDFVSPGFRRISECLLRMACANVGDQQALLKQKLRSLLPKTSEERSPNTNIEKRLKMEVESSELCFHTREARSDKT
jgi:hypothetical protein